MGIRPVWILIAVGGLAIYAATAIFADRHALAEGIRALGAFGLIAVLLLSLGNYALRFWRWDWYLSKAGHSVPIGRHFQYYLAGFALTVTPGKAGEAVRSLYLKQHDVPYSQSLALLFIERLLDLCAIVMLAGAYMLHLPQYRAVAITAMSIVAAIVLTVGAGGWASKFTRGIATHLPDRARKYCEHVADMLDSSRMMLRPARLLIAVLVGLVAWGLEGYGLVILARALDIDLSVSEGVAIYASAILVGAMAFFLPGGVGGAELVMTVLLTRAGAPWHIALIATIMCRLATLWFAVVIGLIAMVLLQRRLPQEQLSRT